MVKAALDRFTTGLAAEVYDDGIAVNSLAPWDNVLTPGAGAHDLVKGYATEDISWIAEAALALCSCDARRASPVVSPTASRCWPSCSGARPCVISRRVRRVRACEAKPG